MAHPTVEVISVPDDVAGLFTLLDEVARGLAREAALAPDERTARAEQILAWFAPRYAAIKAAAAAAPCVVTWTVHVANPSADAPEPDPHPCADWYVAVALMLRCWRNGLEGLLPEHLDRT
jgi:hypothetical protein